MPQSLPSRIIAIAFVAITYAWTSAPAIAQSDSQLRRQNEQLRTRNEQLTEDLRRANERIEELQQEIDDLKRQLTEARAARGRDGTDPLEPEKVTIDESEPLASPRALLRTLKSEYAQAVKDQARGSAGDRERAAYMRLIERWATRVNRAYRKPIEWRVSITDRQPTSDGEILELVAIDPVTKVQLGEAFPGKVTSRSVIRQIQRFADDGKLGDLVLSAIMIPAVEINLRREEEGTFNIPPFIGPYVEFKFGVEVTTIVLPEVAKDDKDGGN